MEKYGCIKSKTCGFISDALDGAKILDDFVVAKNVRVKMGMYKKSDPDERILDFDRSFSSEKSLLQIFVAVLGIVTAFAMFAMMRKLRRAEKKKMKEKLKKARESAKNAE